MTTKAIVLIAVMLFVIVGLTWMLKGKHKNDENINID